MSESIEAVIDEVIIQPSKIQPIIVNFQNGSLKDEETNKIKCGIYRDTKEDKTVLAMSNGQVVYKGYRPDPEKELTYTMLAIHSKRTGKIRLIQAERWQVGPVLDKQVQIDDSLNATDKINNLNKQFGSKKVQRRTEMYEKMKIDFDKAKERLEKSVSHVQIDRTGLGAKSSKDDSSNSDNLPQCNRDATNPAEVYNLYEIVPKDILKPLYEKIDEISEHDNSHKSEFYLESLKHVATDSKMTKKVAILEYIEAVSKWFYAPLRDVKKRNLEICSLSLQLNNYVIEQFSMNGANGRQRPASMKDKGIIHCMILALMIWNYKLDIDLFMKLFANNNRSGVKKFIDLARIIGATPLKDNRKMIVLKIPLPPPVSAIKKGRKRK